MAFSDRKRLAEYECNQLLKRIRGVHSEFDNLLIQSELDKFLLGDDHNEVPRILMDRQWLIEFSRAKVLQKFKLPAELQALYLRREELKSAKQMLLKTQSYRKRRLIHSYEVRIEVFERFMIGALNYFITEDPILCWTVFCCPHTTTIAGNWEVFIIEKTTEQNRE